MRRKKRVKPTPPRELEAEIGRLKDAAEGMARDIARACSARDDALKATTTWRMRAEEQSKQIDDLKVRLQNAESENQRMRGYIERVQEDDVVREELIATGDPDAPTMVPKRNAARFPEPDNGVGGPVALYEHATRTMKPRKPWVTYR